MTPPRDTPLLPARGASRLGRPQVAGGLARALERGAVLVVAPAGSGKTIALEEAVALLGGPVTWVRCSKTDRDPGRLLEHLMRALGAAAPGAVEVLGEKLARGSGPVDVELATSELVADLGRLLVDPLTVVIDDAEQLEGSPESVGLLGKLLRAEIAHLRVAVASRRPMPLRLARRRAQGALVEVGAGELAFSVDECAALIAGVSGPADSAGAAEALWEATEGWPLGVALAAVTRRTTGLPTGGSDALAEYLTDELLEPLDPELRAALIDSSVADEVDPELSEALGLPAGFIDSVRALGIPERTSSGGGLAYHPLVREFLTERLESERSPARRAELHTALADALEARGSGPEAIEHRLAAGDPETAAATIARHGPRLVGNAPATVAGWLERLPAEARAAPELRFLAGRLDAGAGRLDEAIEGLRDAADGYAAEGSTEAEWTARFLLSEALVIKERYEDAIPLADGFESSGAAAGPGVAMSAAAALAGAGRYAESSGLFDRAAAAAPALAPVVRGMHGFWVDLQCGRLDAALAGVNAGLELLECDDPFNYVPYSLGMRAIVEEERGEQAAALESIAAAREAAERTVRRGYITDAAHRFVAGVEARAGRLEQAKRQLTHVEGPGLGWYPGDLEISEATIAAARGEHDRARSLAQLAIERGALERWPARRRSTVLLAPVLVDAGQELWARRLVEEALELCPEPAGGARLLALRGWLRELEGDASGAVADLALAWQKAGPEAAHLLRREGARIGPLLAKAVEADAIDPEEAVAAVAAADPSGEGLLGWTDHPDPAARRASLLAAAASGHPAAPGRIRELGRDGDAAVAAAARAAAERLDREPPPLMIALFGGFEVRRGAYTIDEASWGPRRKAAQRLVRFLIVHREHRVPEDHLFAAFWPEKPADAARRSLQVTVSSARAVLDPDGSERSMLESADRGYRLVLGPRDAVDTDGFERAALAALGTAGSGRDDELEAAAARWGGEPLSEDRYEDWAAPRREQLHDLHGRLLGALADARSEAGDLAGAVEASREQVGLDPLDEDAHRRLMLAYARSGRRGHALRQFLACRRALVDELGIEPAGETAALQRRILAGERL